MEADIPKTLDRDQLYDLVHLNLDARRYFYHKADERWLDWLWQNGFLDVLKEEDASLDGFRTPEIEYLLRMAEKRPDIVMNIMLGTPISTDSRSQEVVYGFLRICRALPADQLERVVDKVLAKRWVPLLDEVYSHSGFAYEEMLSTLAGANDFESFLVLAEAVLAVRPGKETGNASRFRDSPFYLGDLSHTKLFEQLVAVNDEHAERALALTTSKLAEIMAASDQFLLLDVDFFTLESGQSDGWQEDVRELAVAAKTLAVRLIGARCAESCDVRRIYKEHLAPLPESRVIRRFRLFVLSLCPQTFREELKEAFFSLFKKENYSDAMEGRYCVMSGAEYLKALRAGFPVLSERDKLDYVQRTMATFREPPDNRDNGSPLLSMILPYLNEKPALKRKAEEAGFQLDPDCEPRPGIVVGEGGFITPRGPISQEGFGQLPVVEIAGKLRNEWVPEKLSVQNTEGDFFNPLNARGVGDLLQNDMPERLQEYVESADRFFERGAFDEHYTYAYLVGLQETIRSHRETALRINWDSVVDFLIAIKKSGEETTFESERRESNQFESWSANWDAVHMAATDVLRDLLTEQDGKALLDFGKHRNRIFGIVSYLLSYPKPSPADEEFDMPGSALDVKAMREDADTRWATDPLSMAINTVRGRAFEVFDLFVILDGKEIRDDVKELYEGVLEREDTRALMAMFGRSLPMCYFRDKDWTRKLLPRIFPRDTAKKWLLSAAWEGFLSKGLYGEMISDPEIQDLYLRGLDLTDADYPRRQRHFVEPDEGIAEHLALAFMHYKEFGLDHPLLETFWKNENTKQHAHFVNSIGRSFISREKAEESFEFSQEVKSRLRKLWDWLLNKREEREVYMEFGLWINLDKGIFEPAWLAQRVKQTLEKTTGFLTWDIGLAKTGPRLAQAGPEDAFEIVRFYLHEGGVRGNNQQVLWLWDSDNQWIEAFEILYRNPSTRVETEGLINRLVGEGGRAFWPLKRILDEEP